MLSKQFFVFCSLNAIMLFSFYCLWQAGRVNTRFDKLVQDNLIEKQLLSPFIDFDRTYTIAPSHNLSICCIKKSMSTLMMGIACSLYDTKNFMSTNQTILGSWGRQRFCQGKNEYTQMAQVKAAMNGRPFTRIAAVRDPIERFISFFVDKCIFEAQKFPEQEKCYDCQGNVTCFLEKQYARFVQHSLSKHKVYDPSYEDLHAAPLSWNCEFGKHWKEYKIVKLSSNPETRQSGIKDLMNILRTKKVSESTIKFIEKSALSGDTFHATFKSDAHTMLKKQIENDRTIRQWLKKIYYFDYIIFGFDTKEIDQ